MAHLLKRKKREELLDLNARSRTAGEEILWRAGQSALLLSAAFLAYARCISLTGREQLVLVCLLAAALTACAAASFYAPFRRYAVLLPLAGALLVVLASGPAAVVGGFLGALEQMTAWWNLSYEDSLELLPQLQPLAGGVFAFSAVFLLAETAEIWHALEKKSVVRLVILILCVNIPAMVVGRFHPLAFALTVTAAVAVWVYAFSLANLSRSLAWVFGVALFSVVLAFCFGMQNDPWVERLRGQVYHSVQVFRYGEDTLPQGDLSRAGGLFSKDDSTLTVTSGQVKDLYLRGFTGGRYKSGKWLPLQKAAYGGEQAGMLSWLKNEGFHAVTQYADALAAHGEAVPEKNRVTVENTGADRRYAYLPYSAEYPGDTLAAAENRDSQFLSQSLFGIRDYVFQEDGSLLPMELTQAPLWMHMPQTGAEERYLRAERVYRSFVYQNYLELTPEQETLMESIFHSENPEDDPTSVYAAAERIRTTLEERVQYQKQPEQAPAGEDPVSWFLTGGQEGNAAQYASAAVLAFRSFGIPARYVEGYLVRRQELGAAEGGRVELRTDNSHIWAEVYLDGIGWAPVDTTPGYYYDSDLLILMVEKPQGIQFTSAEEDLEEEADELQDDVPDGENGAGADRMKAKGIFAVIPVVLLLLVVPVLLLLILISAVGLFTAGYELLIYRRLPAEERIAYCCRRILLIAGALGVPARIGWEAAVTEEELRKSFPELEAGRYLRANEIMEKFAYGGVIPQPHEERVLTGLLGTMAAGYRRFPFWKRLRFLLRMEKLKCRRIRKSTPGSLAES